MTKPYVTRNAPGHDGSGGTVVVPFTTDTEMQAALDALAYMEVTDGRLDKLLPCIVVNDQRVHNWKKLDSGEIVCMACGNHRDWLVDRIIRAGKHPDDIAVDNFAMAMKAKLAEKRAEGFGGWNDLNSGFMHARLSQLLREHVEKGDPLDVGNLAMMLHQRGEGII